MGGGQDWKMGKEVKQRRNNSKFDNSVYAMLCDCPLSRPCCFACKFRCSRSAVLCDMRICKQCVTFADVIEAQF